jgi:hypothetical protein
MSRISSLKRIPVRRKAVKAKINLPHPLVYDFVIERMKTFGNSTEAIPSRVILLRAEHGDSADDQLFIDQLPIPREAWRYDVADRIISWRGAFGGGHLYVSHDGVGAFGNIGAAHKPCSVSATAKAVFDCDVALDTGATYATSGSKIVGLKWDTKSPAWTSAKWVKNRLQLTYTSTPGGPLKPPTFTFHFEDNETQSVPWDPSSFEASLGMGEQDGRIVWKLTFTSVAPPDPDAGGPFTGPASVYPSWMQAVEDSAAAAINGALQINGGGDQKILVGMRGVRANPAAAGYFKTAPDKALFGIFDGQLVIGGRAVANSHLHGAVLSWSNLDPQQQQHTGLPANGSLHFNGNALLTKGEAGVPFQRLNASDAIAAIAQHNNLHADLHARVTALRLTLDENVLDINGLLGMAPFVQDDKGHWGDAVQAAVTENLSSIMNSCIPLDMWSLLFPNSPPPSLQGEVATIASSPVDGVADPKAWYGTLATAVLSQGMAKQSNPNCQKMNGPRAAAWLKTQMATAPVYHKHGQELFKYQWQQRFNLTSQYQDNQRDYAEKLNPSFKDAQHPHGQTNNAVIKAQTELSVEDINRNVVADSNNPDVKADLIKKVQEAGEYAKTKNLVWAFAFYTYNTAPSILQNIGMQFQFGTGSADGTTVSRLFQQNTSVLTALDPSGYFAKQYTATLNAFLAMNILTNMFGFDADATNFDMIKEYLDQFVKNNINNKDAEIAKAISKVQEILADKNADRMLEDCIAALRGLAGATEDFLGLPYIAKGFVKWFKAEYPNSFAAADLFGSVLIGGITGLAIFNLLTEFKSYNKLNKEQKLELYTNAAQLGLQIVAALVKRGVRIYAIFTVDGMTEMERAAAVSGLVVKGEVNALDRGLLNIGNKCARWLGDTEGTSNVVLVEVFGFEAEMIEEVSVLASIFGRNLDEFMATRLGPVFILAGIGFSLYHLIEGEAGLALASDILNIVSGGLLLCAQIGGWLVAGAEAGSITADFLAPIISCAGPLGILLALAGVGIMLYEMFRTPPDPVADFVNKYVKPSSFYVTSQSNAIDFALPYEDPDHKLLLIGLSLSLDSKLLTVNDNGSVRLGPVTYLPNTVWIANTDGLGLTQIAAAIQPDKTKPAFPNLLSLMSDNTVSFQPKMPAPKANTLTRRRSAALVRGGPTVVTQTWLTAPQGEATVVKKSGELVSMKLTFQPVPPDAKGEYAPSQAKGWLALVGSEMRVDTAPATFKLAMSGMGPNYMQMADIKFTLNTSPTEESFGPSFGLPASTPISYDSSELPAFLSFSKETGTISTNGALAAPALKKTYTISAKNIIGGMDLSAAVEFQITVA